MTAASAGAIRTPVIRYHGGKFRLAPWVIGHFPPHLVYVEPFGGAASVLMQKNRSQGEIYNDLDEDIVNLFRVLRDKDACKKLIEQLVLTPYSRADFELAWEYDEQPVERARRTIIRAQMGFGSAGASKGTTGFRSDCLRQYGTAQQLWSRYPDQIVAVTQRLAGVLIENRPALELMEAHDGKQTLHYVDPPYLHATRVNGAQHGRYYRHELTNDQHEELLAALIELRGMVVLSGYPNEIYDTALVGWTKVTTSARISAGRGGATRTECLWINAACMDGIHSGGLGLTRLD